MYNYSPLIWARVGGKFLNANIMKEKELNELLEKLNKETFTDEEGNSINVIIDVANNNGEHSTLVSSTFKNIMMVIMNLFEQHVDDRMKPILLLSMCELMKEKQMEAEAKKESSPLVTTVKGNA